MYVRQGLFHGMLLPLFFAAILVEIVWYLAIRKRAYPWRETVASLSLFVLRMPLKGVDLAVQAPVAALAWSHRLATVPLDTWWGLALLFLGEEFCYYWFHRLSHEVRWMWATHAVHHTPLQIHLASALRLGLTGALSGGWLIYVPLYLVGFHPVAVSAALAVNLAYQFWLHTDAIGRLGPLDWIFNTPSNHRVHHATNEPYLDRNYGGVIMIWDHVFGTYARERADLPITYGLVHPPGTLNPLKLAVGQWLDMVRDAARATSWRQRLRQLFGRPADSLNAAPAPSLLHPGHSKNSSRA
jgi:sterol desaturase/sphingolipid hydroxylase (fatty acid hydroxylase superfamily)